MKKNEKKKTNKKLLSAFGMFMLSGAMLGTSTYAWFTMSREVEVKNIQLTATTPEDIQISLGEIDGHNVDISLAKNTGYLKGTTASIPTADFDWSNIVDISHYYSFGKLIPASSDTGASIFFTPDANGIGQTVKTNAKYYTAASKAAATAETEVGGSGTGTLNATAHINTATAWSGTNATAWNTTNDDGYYIDIPVWLRTSSTEGAELSVKAYVVDMNNETGFGTDSSGTTTNKELYRAVRVAVLSDTGAAAVATGGNLIPVSDGDGVLGALTNGDKYTGTSILDWYSGTSSSGTVPSKAWGGAVSAVATQGTASPTYNATPTAYIAGTKVAELAAGSGTAYGNPTKLIIRVWLEGEDPDCYNETAGQDWSINLMFENNTTK